MKLNIARPSKLRDDATLSIAELSRYPTATNHAGGGNAQNVRQEIARLLNEHGSVTIDLDGTAGYSSSFLEEVFGGLVHVHGFPSDDLKKRIIIKSEEDPSYKYEIDKIIEVSNIYKRA